MLKQLHNLSRYTAALGGRNAAAKALRLVRNGDLGRMLRTARNVWAGARYRPVPGEPGRDRNDYREWVARYDTLQPADVARARTDIAAWPRRPLVSLLMPTYNTDRRMLVEVIESVRSQLYPNWELCIADDASKLPHVRKVLQDYAARDPRIRIVLRTVNGHICASTNSALEIATGDWLALLDHDDLLPPHALYWIARTVVEQPGVRMIYSDEDKVDEYGTRSGAYFKPDWNAELFRSQNMFSHLGAFEARLVRSVGGFRPGYEGSQDYDLALRCMEQVRSDQIAHVPRVLYHWRVHAESTASSNDAKPYAQVAAERALNDHLARTGQRGSAQAIRAGYRCVWPVPDPAPTVAVVVRGDTGTRHARRALKAVLRSDWPQLRVYVEGPGGAASGDARVQALAAGEAGQPGFGARLAADGCSLVAWLPAGAEPLASDWLREMVGQALRPTVGLVAPLLQDLRGTVLSAGVVAVPGERGCPAAWRDLHAGWLADAHGYGGRLQLAQFASWVRPECLVMRLELHQALAANERPEVDDGSLRFCASLGARGLDLVWTPFAQFALPTLAPLQGPAPKPSGQVDRNYHPSLHSAEADFSLAWPSLVTCVGSRPTAGS
jgi:hypothetical protein